MQAESRIAASPRPPSTAPLWGVIPRSAVPGLPAEDPPEPADWRPRARFRDRALAAVGAPVIVGVVLFTGAVASSVVLGLAQPHDPATADVGAGATDTLVDGSGQDPASVVSPGTRGGTGSLEPGTEPSPMGGGPAAPAATGELVVHVIGKVRRPGVVTLQPGARVQDAIERAGGATDRRALSSVNLARPVVDGEQIAVVRSAVPVPVAGRRPGGPNEGVAGAAGAVQINLNAADGAALEALPGVGPALAQRITDWRTEHGGFTSVEQLLDVPGIGPKILEGFRDQVSV